MYKHCEKHIINNIFSLSARCCFTVWLWPLWSPGLWWRPEHAPTAAPRDRLVPATVRSSTGSEWWRVSSPPAASQAWEFQKSWRRRKKRRNTDSKIYIYYLHSQNTSLIVLNKRIIHLYGKLPYISMFIHDQLALGLHMAEEQTKMHVCLVHLPNMLVMSSGSQSFSSLVKIWRRKRTVGLSSSPKSMT